MRTHYCNATYPCNCAIAAREGDDVLVIDMCRRPYTVGVKFLSTVQPRLTTVERSKNGRSLEVSILFCTFYSYILFTALFPPGLNIF